MGNPGKRLTGGGVRFVIGILAAAALALFALQSSALIEWLGLERFGKTETLRLGAYDGDVGALEWIAQDQGFFRKVGLAVEIKGYPSGKEAADALRAGQVDVATASEFVAAARSFGEADLRILGSIAYYRNKGIVGRRDRGIAVPADLKGKRIGVTSPSGAEYSLYVFLALHGLGGKDVAVVSLPPKRLGEALAAGDIDAAITWQPHVQEIEAKLGDGGVSFRGDGFDTWLLLLTRRDSAALGRPTRKLMQALVLAEEWAQAHPEEARQYLATRFKLERAYIDALWANMQLEVTLPQELLVAMAGQARWLARSNGRGEDSIPNYAEFMRTDELKAAKPSAVTLFSRSGRVDASAAR